MFGFMLPKGALSYAFMPQVMWRMNGLLTGGFHYLPFFLAIVYRNFRLLPEGHPYLMQKNIGLFGVRHVIAQAALGLRFSFRNMDQIILFVIILSGILLIFLQLMSVGAYLFLGSAMAIPTNWTGFFTINPLYRTQDLASIMLDYVFGVPHGTIPTIGFFESCASGPVPCLDMQLVPSVIPDPNIGALGASTIPPADFSVTASGAAFPWPQHAGLHRMFSIYSNGLLVIACGMVSYFIATILAETAQSGTPFGRRYNQTWVPIRIIMAFGLLMPLGSGLNSSQYIVLYAAKYGSAFASNGWYYFNDSLTGSYLGASSSLVSTPSVPGVGGFLQFMFLANVCEVLYEHLKYDDNGDGATDTAAAKTPDVYYNIEAYIQGPESVSVGTTLAIAAGTTYNNAITTMGTNNIMIITFGEKNQKQFPSERGFVKPLCGEIRWTLADPRLYPGGPGSTYAELGPGTVQEGYWILLKELWLGTDTIPAYKVGTVPLESATANRRDHNFIMLRFPEIYPPNASDNDPQAFIGQNYKTAMENNTKLYIKTLYSASVLAATATAMFSSGGWMGPTNPLYNKGWAAAGIWYNVVAELNGNMTAAAYSLPLPYRYPDIMVKVKDRKLAFSNEVDPKDGFTPEAPKLDSISMYAEKANGQRIAAVLSEAYRVYDAVNAESTHTKKTGDVVYDIITVLLGTNGLYDMRQNANTHPLAQLVGVGRALVESAVRNLGFATLATVSGISVEGLLGSYSGELAATASSLLVSIAMIQLSIGFVLFYIVPFLPFIYFFFAVGGWIKGIFEALVGAPLWALAHIRIDAHGLPGNAALNGYFLIFEVFLRPILIVFGLLASISIFAALVSVLNSVFPTATSNLTGYGIDVELEGVLQSTIDDMRGKVDQFFFTVMYAVIVYMMAMSSFKLIDTIPNNILRWMGSSVATFNDQREDSAAGLMSKASMGAQQATSRIGGGLQDVAKLPSKK